MKKAILALWILLCFPSLLGSQEAVLTEPKVVCSLNGFFCASSDPERAVTTVYRRRAGGVVQALWSMKGYLPVAFLSNDGEYLAAGYYGGGVLPSNYRKNQVMISFYDRGRLVKEVRLDEIIRDFSKMPKVDEQYRWGGYLGLNADDYLTVQLFDQNWMLFDIRSGRLVK